MFIECPNYVTNFIVLKFLCEIHVDSLMGTNQVQRFCHVQHLIKVCENIMEGECLTS